MTPAPALDLTTSLRGYSSGEVSTFYSLSTCLGHKGSHTMVHGRQTFGSQNHFPQVPCIPTHACPLCPCNASQYGLVAVCVVVGTFSRQLLFILLWVSALHAVHRVHCASEMPIMFDLETSSSALGHNFFGN